MKTVLPCELNTLLATVGMCVEEVNLLIVLALISVSQKNKKFNYIFLNS